MTQVTLRSHLSDDKFSREADFSSVLLTSIEFSRNTAVIIRDAVPLFLIEHRAGRYFVNLVWT